MPIQIALPHLKSTHTTHDNLTTLIENSNHQLSTISNDYQSNVGPGSYNLPATIGSSSLYKRQPCYAIAKTKRSYLPPMTDGPGILYYPDISKIRHHNPHYKIGNSGRDQMSHYSLTITPGPIYDIEGTLSNKGPKFIAPKFNRPKNNKMDYQFYRREGLFEEGLRKKRGCPIGKAAKHFGVSSCEWPGPGQYEHEHIVKKGISFTKVFFLLGVKAYTNAIKPMWPRKI